MIEALALLPQEFWLGLFFVLGLCFGSFANVIIYRLPEGLSVVRPGSRCSHCKTPLRWFHNIPVFSWVFLRARCGFCKTKISWRYPLVELLGGVLFAMCFYHAGWSLTLIELLLFSFGLLVVSFIDFDHYILPDVFTLSGIVLGLLGSLINPDRSFMSALGGVLMGGGFLWAIAAIYFAIRKEEGMGGGDIKLLAWIGAVLGWASVPFVILVASLVGSVVGILFGLFKGSGIKTAIPFGPYLSLAALIYIFFGQELGHWYLQMFLPLPTP